MLQTSYEAKTKDLWVFIETKDGKAIVKFDYRGVVKTYTVIMN